MVSIIDVASCTTSNTRAYDRHCHTRLPRHCSLGVSVAAFPPRSISIRILEDARERVLFYWHWKRLDVLYATSHTHSEASALPTGSLVEPDSYPWLWRQRPLGFAPDKPLAGRIPSVSCKPSLLCQTILPAKHFVKCAAPGVDVMLCPSARELGCEGV